ncbi:MAG: carboxypeptidase-like regulatory domain-containing protein [Pseudolabrys sp.]
MPAFEVALIEPTGDAVIAGTAAPGAAVELLRNGESYDRAIADQFGHFVMVPSRLPPGDYELTLRSRQLNGKHATSRRSVAVAVHSQTDQNMALMTPDKASVGLSKPVVPSAVRHPPRARREATGPVAQDVSGLRRKLFNHLVGPHH